MSETIDLGFLAKCGVLPSAPPWSAVGPALSRLNAFIQNGIRYPELEADTRGASEFARNTRLCQHTMADALFTAACVGQFKTGVDFNTAVLIGLRTISQVYRLPERSSRSEVDAALAQLASELRSMWPALGQALHRVHETKSDVVADWSVLLQELRELFRRTSLFDDRKRQEIITAAWLGRKKYFFTSAPDKPYGITVNDLFCRAGEVGPATVLGDDPARMTLSEWSATYFSSLQGSNVPKSEQDWLALQALEVLGWPMEGSGSALLAKLSDEERMALKERTGRSRPGRRVLIVTNDKDSGIRQWGISKSYLAVTVPAELIERWVDPTILSSLAIEAVFAEDGANPTGVAAINRMFNKRGLERIIIGTITTKTGSSDSLLVSGSDPETLLRAEGSMRPAR